VNSLALKVIVYSLSVAGLLLALGASNASFATKAKAKEYTMGVFPYLPPREMEKVFAPIAEDLGNAISKKIRLRSNTTFKKFMSSLDDQVFDIVFVQPFDYIHIADIYGYEPLATHGDKLASILIVKDNSPIKSIKDIKGKTIAFPPKVAAVSRLMIEKLRESGINLDKDVKIRYLSSHKSCLQHVLKGAVDLCGTALPMKLFFEREMKVKMRIVVKSHEIPHVLFAIHPRVPKQQRELLRQRILSWGHTVNGKSIVPNGRLVPFKAIKDSDYDVVRKMAR